MTRSFVAPALIMLLSACGPGSLGEGDGGSSSEDDVGSSDSTGTTDTTLDGTTDESSSGTDSSSDSESDDPTTVGDLDLPPADCMGLDSNLPLVIIDTMGQFIPDEPKIDAKLTVIDNGPGMRNCIDDTPSLEVDIGIETRGSTSQQYPKKSFGVETRDEFGQDLPVSIFGMPVEADWVLYAPYPDKTMVRNALTFHLHREMGHYSSRTQHFELVLNNQYWGVYVWMERIKRDPGRVAINKLDVNDVAGDALTGGYILKVDKLTGDVGHNWVSPHSDEVTIQVHYPKGDQIAPEQAQYIQTQVTAFEDMLAGPGFADPQTGYPAWIDVESYMDFMILQELGRTVDGYRSSSFFHKDRDSVDGRFVAGPMWDFNLSYGNADYCQAFSTTGYQYNFEQVCGQQFDVEVPFWWTRLLEDPAFADALRCRWESLRQGPLSDQAIADFVGEQAELLAEAQVRNFERWPILGQYVPWNAYVGDTYEEELAYLLQWTSDRAAWLDGNFAGTCP
ncbi:MAG: CotH kinase family protein [Myxococcales bacterium]|nr:CotH kinase family protein [Myxococcales bacterium]